MPCDSATGAQPWRAALQALETELPRFADGRTVATVILSNHFLRYTLVPWRDELSDAEEELAFARHCFARVYGKAAEQWELRLSQEAPESPRLASARGCGVARRHCAACSTGQGSRCDPSSRI